ncbi:MAG TPA: dCTP deaminase [Acidimicrobiales bacterium]|nr:dCTP deaminase [Acidimicrobiales bacterium]
MILSDRTIREELAAGRIVIEPLDESCIQPSSVDLRLDRLFRVFLNHTAPVIDVKKDLSDLTELVEIDEGDAFILHPGEFVLGSTAETVTVPDDLVARIEGKSSLGRLGLLIHSSLPASEEVLVLEGGRLALRRIDDLVRKQLRARVAAFDPVTFEVGYHQVTGWYEGPPDRIFEVELRSGRRVRVTAGHNLFTLDDHGELAKVRTGALRVGVAVAVPGRLPDPPGVPAPPAGSAGSPAPVELALADLLPDPSPPGLSVRGPSVAARFESDPGGTARSLALAGLSGPEAVASHRRRASLPLTAAALLPGLVGDLGTADRFTWEGSGVALPARLGVDGERAWLAGLCVALGVRRDLELVVATPDREVLDRAGAVLAGLGVAFRRSAGSLGVPLPKPVLPPAGRGDPRPRVPAAVLGWPVPLVDAFLAGVDDGRRSGGAGAPATGPTVGRHLPGDLLLLGARRGAGAPCPGAGGLLWDEVVAVRDTGTTEVVYDLEVRPGGRKIENFLAGSGGVFVSNTAGFVDAGFSGHITLELSNVASLPITLYPGMKIGQVSFLRMTTPADVPYGSAAVGSKYQGQRGPTPSRYWENFADEG